MSARTSISKIHGIERELCLGLLMFLMILAGLYVYFVGKSIVNVVVREEVELQIADVNSRLSELELTYITQKDAITMRLAEARGFHSVKEKTFVSRGTLGQSLSRNSVPLR